MLSPYRVLDLTNEGALLCGQILGDLGADVILVEPRGGVKARNVGPFCGSEHNPNRSVNFWAFNHTRSAATIDSIEGSRPSRTLGGGQRRRSKAI